MIRRLHALQLRTQLSALLVALLLFGCASIGLATTLSLRSYLNRHLDNELKQAGSRYAAALEHNDSDADNIETSTVGQSVGTLGARVKAGHVTAIGVVSEPGTTNTIGLSDRAVIAALQPARGYHDIELPILGDYRVQVVSGRDGDVLVTGLPRNGVEETLHRVWLAEALVFVIVIVGVGALGTLAVRRALLPLDRVTATALRVSELPLATSTEGVSVRVPESDPDTEVGRVAVAVNHMLAQVDDALVQRQRSEERLRAFIADASHELRTPIAVIRSHAELIAQTGGDVAEPVRRSLDRIESETARMGVLVDDLLLLARLDAGQPLAREEVDLSRTAIDALTDAQVAGRDHSWSLELPDSDEPVTVTGDPHRIHQIIANLLSNARIHTPPGTSVALSVEPVAAPGSGVDIVVADDGPGIPADLVARVHERFVRADGSRTRAHGSSGLGLAIVNSVVEAHGGTLTITSRPGETRVVIHLPDDPQRGATTGAGSPSGA